MCARTTFWSCTRIVCRVLFCVCVVAIPFREKRGSPFYYVQYREHNISLQDGGDTKSIESGQKLLLQLNNGYDHMLEVCLHPCFDESELIQRTRIKKRREKKKKTTKQAFCLHFLRQIIKRWPSFCFVVLFHNDKSGMSVSTHPSFFIHYNSFLTIFFEKRRIHIRCSQKNI